MREDIRKLTKYDFPVSRIGNTTNPKMVILLENLASHPDRLTLNPEYFMYLAGVFKPSIDSLDKNKEHMDFKTVIDYDKWWYDFSYLWEQSTIQLQPDEILALEYYPYATSLHRNPSIRQKEKNKEIYVNQWEGDNKFAKESLVSNLKLLASAIKNKVPIFVYYKSGWYSVNKNIDIKSLLVHEEGIFISHYDRYKAVHGSIRERLVNFMERKEIQTRITELRNDKNYQLDHAYNKP